MAPKAISKPDEKPASTIIFKALKTIQKAFYYLGKPFYFVLSTLLIAFLSLAFLIGNFIRRFFIFLFKLPQSLLQPAGERNQKKPVTTIKPKIPSKKVTGRPPLNLFSRLSRLIKILILKIRLIGLKLKSSFKISAVKPKIILIIIIILIPLFFLIYLVKDLPSPSELSQRKIEVSTKIYDRHGVLLYTIYKDKNRTPIKLNELPSYVKLATLAAEDAEFYQHPGFSIKGIARALTKNLTQGELSGGSTITQQLVKNALLTPEKTLTRKIREIILAVLVEAHYSKDQILEMYLNEVSYGGTAYGIEEASQTYFGKSAKEISLAEAAFLAGLPKSPTKYSPFGESPQLGLSRQKDVLRLMKINGFITEEEEKKAQDEKINFSLRANTIKAPHFVMFTRKELEDRFSKEVVETGGLEVITTLDYSIQLMAEKVVSQEVNKLKNLNVKNGAALVINPQTGEILAMVGSKDYFDTQNDGNVNVTTSLRQPGSSIKVVNYAYALGHGFTPASILSDTPITYKIAGQPDYSPTNYDHTYRGNLTLRSALAESRNIPAVRVLASYGVEKMIENGRKMGITSWEEKDRFGLSLTLGGGEIKLIDLAKVYATLANYGRRPEIKSLIKVTNYEGKALYQDTCLNSKDNPESDTENVYALTPKTACEGEPVIDPRVAYLLTDILKDNEARTPAFGSKSALVIPGHSEVAVKTGTSNNLRDNLTVGYTQDYLVAVWVGNNDNSPMSHVVSGVTGAAPIFNKIMTSLLENKEPKLWPVPEGLVQLPICPFTATLACNGCPVKMEWFLAENKPTKACSPEFVSNLKNPQPEPQILEPAARIEVAD